MSQTSVAFPGSTQLPKDLQDKLVHDLNTSPVRRLTKEEREIYAGAAINATTFMPAFRDAIGLLNPYMDATAKTAYTDRYARVGVSYWFLYLLNPYQRASVLLHECMHVLNNHFVRGEMMGLKNQLMNIAGDFEINTTLERVPQIDLSVAIFPDKGEYSYPKGLTLEQYATLLKDDGKGESNSTSGPDGDSAPDPNGQPTPGSGSGSGDGESEDGEGGSGQPGNGGGSDSSDQSGGGGSSISDEDSDKKWGCSSSTEKRSASADDAGIERASSAEQSTAKSNTIARISEEINSSRAAGNGHMNEFYKIVLDQISPPKVDWRKIFERVMSRANDAVIRGRSDYSYRRVSRRLSDSKYIFPGMVKYVPKAMLGVDISGSMTKDDYQKTLIEAEGIMKTSSKVKGGLQVFSVDTQVGKIQLVSSVKELDLYGGGGTAMEVSIDFVASLAPKERPDIFVLATDGGTDWAAFERSCLEIYNKVKIVVLVTSEYGWGIVPESLKDLITMIDVTGK
jgi:predicted metal-dependent peptidase